MPPLGGGVLRSLCLLNSLESRTSLVRLMTSITFTAGSYQSVLYKSRLTCECE